jgi:Rieske Fe-S protein
MSELNHPDQPNPPCETAAPDAKAALHSRRAFLFKLSLVLNAAAGVVLAVPLLGYLLGPALKKGSSTGAWIALGGINDFPVGETRLADFRSPVASFDDGDTAKVACWVRRISDRQFQVFAVNCAHLGCPVRWFAQSKLFLCPCHGGAYYEDGSRASGPPERGLFEYRYQLSGDTLLIHAGDMPTLATQASCNKPKPLTQISPATSDSAPVRSEWPA